ncbi:hypothetical protein BDA99DRAFT_605045 [Phascolomyces articulosus]|uniref:Myb-like domain-containing protein n=1 Tax=Phascolomyces articulosus TaxID=60185 RepID=A0AAD5K0R0_9FUNG|nr:hypothetical protein BDA99DRAFT_605045 [Phascolomyces articulosus]
MVENEPITLTTTHKENHHKRSKKKKKSKDRDNALNNNSSGSPSSKRKHDHGKHTDESNKKSKKRKIGDLMGAKRNQETASATAKNNNNNNNTNNTHTATTTTATTTTTNTSTTPITYESASDSDSDDNEKTNQMNKRTTVQKRNKPATLTQNRILPHLHFVYEDTVDKKSQIKNRRMIHADIKVNRDYYISDSDEESDSDDDYSGAPLCEWHRKVYINPEKIKSKVKNGEWNIKTGKFSVEELIKLEKRIKKIGRRENLTLEQLRETVLAENHKPHMKFWYQVVKAFPDRSLSQIYHHTKTGYHEDAYKGRWTAEQDEELLDLAKKFDSKFIKVAEKLNRTRQACSDRYRQLTNKPTQRKNWTKDELGILEKAVKEYTEKHGKSISWEYIANNYFADKRNPLQIRKKWESIGTTFDSADTVVRNMKDVTIQVQLKLFEQMQKMGWKAEDDIDYNKVNSDDFKINKETARRTYYKMRDSLHDCDKMKYPEIIDRLVTTRRAMVESLKE